MKCFVTAGDYKNQDILKWFIDLHNKYSKYPLYVADCGCLDKSIPNLLTIETLGKTPWFFKPKIMLKTPTDSVCWIDCDIELKSSIDDIFDATPNNCLGVTLDAANPKCEYATGLVCTHTKEMLIQWKNECELFVHRGDQEALEKIKKSLKLHTLPIEYQWLRIGPKPTKNVKAIHWTGPKGKKYIREHLIL
jgi:hypothetical protein